MTAEPPLLRPLHAPVLPSPSPSPARGASRLGLLLGLGAVALAFALARRWAEPEPTAPGTTTAEVSRESEFGVRRIPTQPDPVDGTEHVSPTPPGLVLVPGGPTKIGITRQALHDEVTNDETAWRYARVLSDQIPQFTAIVPDFHLMVTEVTNEQYAAFVRATDCLPPMHWGAEALEEAQRSFLEQQGQLRLQAHVAGPPLPERREFDRKAWWREHGSETLWSIPADLERSPVVYVDHADAAAYARWAGLRLMSEEEYQRAVRGDTERFWPWGFTWEDTGLALTSAIPGRESAARVGSFPQGQSEHGVFDLAGNVWEWTSTPYTAYGGWRMPRFRRGHGRTAEVKDGVIPWDAEDRVAVGGSFQNEPIAARCTTRLQVERFQNTDALGFRCAASPAPGVDVASGIRARLQAFLTQVGAPPLDPDPARLLAIDRWHARVPETEAPPGYAVIEAYEHVVFVPCLRGVELAETSGGLERGAVILGALSLSLRRAQAAQRTKLFLLTDSPSDPEGRVRLVQVQGTGSDVTLDRASLTPGAVRAVGEEAGPPDHRLERVNDVSWRLVCRIPRTDAEVGTRSGLELRFEILTDLSGAWRTREADSAGQSRGR